MRPPGGLNPFMNQVYLYEKALKKYLSVETCCLNPFMNQVYLYGFRYAAPKILTDVAES